MRGRTFQNISGLRERETRSGSHTFSKCCLIDTIHLFQHDHNFHDMKEQLREDIFLEKLKISGGLPSPFSIDNAPFEDREIKFSFLTAIILFLVSGNS